MLGFNSEVCKDPSFPLLTLWLFLGVVLVLHGSQKVFGLFGGPGLDGWTQYITGVKMPIINSNFPSWLAKLAAFTELLAGVALLLGLGVRIAALLIAIFLAFAIYIVHWKNGFFIQNNGYEYALTLIVISLILVVCGGGKY